MCSFNGHATENIGTGNETNVTGEHHDYEKLIMKPVRPAPVAPVSPNSFSNSSYQGIDVNINFRC
jgi:hypothetical protein